VVEKAGKKQEIMGNSMFFWGGISCLGEISENFHVGVGGWLI
jgi:hypothetical protein